MARRKRPKNKAKGGSKPKRRNQTIPPAQGERNAKSGFRAQDRYSASILLDNLRKGLLLGIRIADPTAGRVDDFQMLTAGRVDAWQVKWETYPGFVSISHLIAAGDKPPLIQQLADGWKRVQAQRLNTRVVVHLATNSLPSKHDKVLPPGAPKGGHLAAFLEECWKPLKSQLLAWTEIPEKWAAWLQALETSSGLAHEDFEAFVADCDLDFGCRVETAGNDSREALIRTKEMDRVADFLFAAVASPEKLVELSRDELLQRLGWEDAASFRNTHEFRVDGRTYQPIKETEELLQAAIEQTTNGYLCLLGTPGSGKSSLLAKTFSQRPERVLRYFAYVPDSQDPGSLRGESENFLHDQVLALRHQGIIASEGTVSEIDRLALLKEWKAQLNKLHIEWVNQGRKTIIVIDGLDHIEREQHPQRSLLKDLLPPSEVPQGIVFVLGTQVTSILPDRVQHQVGLPGRNVRMQPLTKSAVGKILGSSELPQPLAAFESDRVYELSAGHPLALAYLVNKLKSLAQANDVAHFLANSIAYTGDIEQTYFQYWRTIVDQNADVIPVLALVSRIRGFIDLDWLDLWEERSVIVRFIQTSSYLFRMENAKRWYFFHNSFRLFLEKQTARTIAGEYSEEENKKLHSILADRCQLPAAPQHWKWEELYHRYMAQQHKTVLALVDQSHIRSQFFSFRSPSAIHTDLVLASRSLRFVHDGVAAIRIGLLMAEIQRRKFTLQSDETSLIETLIASGNVTKALSWIRDGNRLLMANSTTLYLCEPLFEANHREEARRLFDLVDPLNFIEDPHGMVPEEYELSNLAHWYFAARLFEPVESCLKTLSGIRFKVQELGQRSVEYANDTENQKLYRKLIARIISGCIARRKWNDVESLLPHLRLANSLHNESLMHSVEARLDDGDFDEARRLLTELLAVKLPQSFLGKIRVAESYARLGDGTEAQRHFSTIQRPTLTRVGSGIPNGFDAFEPLFRYDRLAFYCDSTITASRLVPTDGSVEEGAVSFQKVLCTVAEIWAKAWRKETTDPASFQYEVKALLQFYHRDQLAMEHWSFGYEIRYSRGDLYSLLAEACAAHGPQMVEMLAASYDEIWESYGKRFWPLELQSAIVVQLVRLGVSAPWAKKWIERFESEIGLQVSADTHVSESSRQAAAWLVIDEKDKALARVEIMLKRSFGIGDRKDYQLSTWIELFGKLAPNLPDRGLTVIAWIATCIHGLKEAVGSKALSQASADLLEICLRLHPDKAFTLFSWLEAKEAFWYEKGLRAVLRADMEREDGDLKLHATFIDQVLLPISTQAAPSLLRRFLNKVRLAHGEIEYRNVVKTLVNSIQTVTSSEIRTEWLHGVARALSDQNISIVNFDLDPGLLRWEEKHSTSHQLILTDGKVEYLPDLVARVRTVAEIKKLKELEKETSYFRWNHFLEEVIGHFQAADILRIVDLFSEHDRFSEVCEAVSTRLIELGSTAEAWDLGLKAKEKSAEKTWLRFMDGGPRLSAFLTLLRADEQKGRPLLFEALSVDGPPASENISLLIPYLVNETETADLWLEIRNHLEALLEGTAEGIDGPPLVNQTNPPSDTPVIIEILLRNLTHPAITMRNTSQKGLSALVSADHGPARLAIKQRLQVGSPEAIQLLESLLAVAVAEPEKCNEFKAEIQSAYDSESYQARALCLEIAKHCHWTDFKKTRIRQSLSAMYELELPPVSAADKSLVQPMNDNMAIIAERSGLPLPNLYHRLTEIIRRLDANNETSASAERQIRSQLSEWGLQMRFLKPRVKIVKRSLFILLGELADAGRIPQSAYSELPYLFRDFDPCLVAAKPTSRPASLPPLTKEDNGISYDQQWVEARVNILDRIPRTEPSNWIIIGSSATFRIANWSDATERTASSIHLTQMRQNNASWVGSGLFDEESVCGTSDYYAWNDAWTQQHFIVESSPLLENSGAPFYALHPGVALAMGWRRSQQGLFSWMDNTGKTIVESRWWQDGPIDIRNLYGDVEVAEGWYVAVAPEAVASFKQHFGPISFTLHAQRSVIVHNSPTKGPLLSEQIPLTL